MAESEYILGRKSNQQAWKVASRRAKNRPPGCFVVTAYDTYRGDKFYAGACYVGSRSGWDKTRPLRRVKPGSNRYRVIVTPKRPK
jgi:hypothetical protein